MRPPLTGSTAPWTKLAPEPDLPERKATERLYKRLFKSLANTAEQLIMISYAKRYTDPDVPALIPQVYLHFDPYTRRELGARIPAVKRQHMDFLLLFHNQVRVVIELDGIQHYADPATRQADPARYAEMVAEDRQLRLRGYEVYRIGGEELADKEKGAAMLDEFFELLVARYSSRAD